MSIVETSIPSVADVMALLAEQRDLYLQLAALGRHQRSLITRDETESLLAVLGRRQAILDRLETLAEGMKPCQQHWSRVRQQMSAEEGARADRLLSDVQALLSEILRKDEADARLLAARMGGTARAIGDLKARRQAGSAYAAAASLGPVQAEWTDE